MQNIVYQKESYQIIGACFEVYNQKGFGFTELVYQECLAIEFELQGISFVEQPEIQLEYKGRILEQFFRPDFVCFDKIIVEIKAVSAIIDSHISQTLNYLSATKFELALLINFGEYPKLNYKRIANNRKPNKSLREEIDSWEIK